MRTRLQASARHDVVAAFQRARVRPKTRLGFVFLATVLFVTACDSDQILCPGEVVTPIIVEVRDATTGAPAAKGAGGEIRSRSFVSPLFVPHPDEDLELHANGPPATYEVLVRKPGYRDWSRTGVYVQGGRCGVARSTRLRANLDPTS